MPNSSKDISGNPSIALDANKKAALGQGGLNIDYRGRDNCPYGEEATKDKEDFIGLVIHHTDNDHDTDWYVNYQFTFDKERDGHFGYHFYISPKGKVIQGAPLTVRTNHVKRSDREERKKNEYLEFQNKNTIGISCVGAGDDKTGTSNPTQLQKQAVYNLAFSLCKYYGISFDKVAGHSELQTDRGDSEGKELAKKIRSWFSPAKPGV